MSNLWALLGIAVVVVSAVAGGIAYAMRAERKSMKLAQEEANDATEARIVDALVSAPRTPAEAVDRLRKHEF